MAVSKVEVLANFKMFLDSMLVGQAVTSNTYLRVYSTTCSSYIVLDPPELGYCSYKKKNLTVSAKIIFFVPTVLEPKVRDLKNRQDKLHSKFLKWA